MSFFNNLNRLFGQDKERSQAKKKRRSQPKSQRKAQPKSQPKPQTQAQTSQMQAEQAKLKKSIAEAKAQAKNIIIEAKDEALTIRTEAENRSREASKQLEKQQQSLDSKLNRIDQRLTSIEQKENRVEQKELKLEQLEQQLAQAKTELTQKLETIAGLTKAEAQKQLFTQLEKTQRQKMAQYIRQEKEKAQQEADQEVKEVLIDAMRHGATDYVAEYTISTIDLPSENVKGKIIGKSGRNIHAFERMTGVDLDLDAEPKSVRISCFDPVRREIARIALKRLIKDGRIQPTRIEETVNKVRQEIDKVVFKEGKKLCHKVEVYNLPNELMKLLGRYKFRFSYGQNLVSHTLEVTQIGTKLAYEFGVDVNTVKLGCLLHDIGKISDDPDGSHVEQGIKILKKFDLPQEVIDCVAQHHEDESFSGPEQMLVYVADAVSGARPGARYDNYDEYVERLEQLEEIATAYQEVDDAYAIQAGREIRVLLDPKKSKSDDVTVLANKIKDQIEDQVTYPGTVTVTVIRESRQQAVAK